MAVFSSRSDQLWYFAAQLFEEEAKSTSLAQQEEHGQRIQTKFNQLASNLSCLGDIIATLYQEKKLTPKEFECIKHLIHTPIRANEELLNIIGRKSRDVFDCFLSLVKSTNQLHLYQMLVSDIETCDEVEGEDVLNHKDLIFRNFMWLSEKLDTETGLISELYQRKVLTDREREDIFSRRNGIERNESLLLLISRKSLKDFETYLEVLEISGQGHLIRKLRKSEASSADRVAVPSTDMKATIICHKLHPKELKKCERKRDPDRSSSKPIPPPKPDAPSTSANNSETFMHSAIKTRKKEASCLRTRTVTFQERLKGLESRLQTDIAIKATCVSVFRVDKVGDNLKMCFHILLQDCYQMKKDIVEKQCETNMEMDQLRKTVGQYSAASTLNEVTRTQLISVKQELRIERFQNNKERKQFEEKINKLKTDIQNEQVKRRQLEEEKTSTNTTIMELKNRLEKAGYDVGFFQSQVHELNSSLAKAVNELQKTEEHIELNIKIENEKATMKSLEEEKLSKSTFLVEIKDRLQKTECDKQLLHQHIHELSSHLTLTERELQKTKGNLEECNSEIFLLRKQLKEEFETRKKEIEMKNDIALQLVPTQENNQVLLSQIKVMDSSLELAKEEQLALKQSLEDRLEEKLLEIVKFEKELESVKCQRQELEDNLNNATQLDQLNTDTDSRNITFTDKENQTITINQQFLLENIRTDRLIHYLHVSNCITNGERDHFINQPDNFNRNVALLQWMRTISF